MLEVNTPLSDITVFNNDILRAMHDYDHGLINNAELSRRVNHSCKKIRKVIEYQKKLEDDEYSIPF